MNELLNFIMRSLYKYFSLEIVTIYQNSLQNLYFLQHEDKKKKEKKGNKTKKMSVFYKF